MDLDDDDSEECAMVPMDPLEPNIWIGSIEDANKLPLLDHCITHVINFSRSRNLIKDNAVEYHHFESISDYPVQNIIQYFEPFFSTHERDPYRPIELRFTSLPQRGVESPFIFTCLSHGKASYITF